MSSLIAGSVTEINIIFAAMPASKATKRYVRYTFVYGFVRFLIWLSNVLPRKVWLSFTGFLGVLGYYFANETRKLAVRHLQMAFPDKSSSQIKTLAKRTFKMLGKNAGEIIRTSRVKSLEALNKVLVTHGYENFERAHAKGKGVIFLTCHLGPFDLQVTNMAMRGLNPHIIGTPLKDPRLNELLWNYRNAHGAIAIERGRETFKMIKVLKSGGSVALLIDQDTKVKTVFVNFFGKPAATPVGATVLAMKTGASIVPTYVHLGDDGLQHMHILPEISLRQTGNEDDDVIYNTQILSNFIEDTIRKHPDQWVWMHERWKTQPETIQKN
jgi:Kdo2-lipid IVA lauroyltransferase/acyltransferase